MASTLLLMYQLLFLLVFVESLNFKYVADLSC